MCARMRHRRLACGCEPVHGAIESCVRHQDRYAASVDGCGSNLRNAHNHKYSSAFDKLSAFLSDKRKIENWLFLYALSRTELSWLRVGRAS